MSGLEMGSESNCIIPTPAGIILPVAATNFLSMCSQPFASAATYDDEARAVLGSSGLHV